LTRFWLGPSFRARRAVLSVELLPQRERDSVYITYYEREATGCRTGAIPTGDRPPPEGEIVVSSRARRAADARNTLRIVNGQNGTNVPRPRWPRFDVSLDGSRTATAIPVRGRIAGLGGLRGFLVITSSDLITVSGEMLTNAEIRDAARSLRSVARD
jgi:hypothetical protein